jgi:hypothetical protein
MPPRGGILRNHVDFDHGPRQMQTSTDPPDPSRGDEPPGVPNIIAKSFVPMLDGSGSHIVVSQGQASSSQRVGNLIARGIGSKPSQHLAA